MICKELTIPLILEKTEALSGRIVQHHLKIPLIEKDLRKRRAGYNGESTVYYHLNFLKDKKYKIYYNVRLPILSNHFQMDFLLLTRFYILIIEVYNHLTNSELRKFLHLQSRNTAYKILKSFQLKTEGGTKSVIYSKPPR
ncbi:nuclease-related domain-containing protein [Rossellomorea sp. LjRoot5]|uniref:nuclease-related domain-containing protein n=1 Tax=Rossellomorea sp. LjRoot5 TaxID=3342331 RepID=UPI003F502EC3